MERQIHLIENDSELAEEELDDSDEEAEAVKKKMRTTK